MCLTVSEEPKSGYFGGSGNAQKCSPIKLMVIASLLYVILACKRFCRNALPLDSGGDTVLGGEDYKEE